MSEKQYTEAEMMEKIKKMILHAESARKIGSEAEAQKFESLMAKLLERYQLSMDDIEFEEHRTEEDIMSEQITGYDLSGANSRQRDSLTELLCSILGRHYGFKLLVVPGSNTIYLVGREAARTIGKRVCASLVQAMNSLSSKAYDRFYYQCEKDDCTHEARGYRKSWKAGFIRGIKEQLATRAAVDEECTALVRVKTEYEDADAFVKKMNTASAEAIGRTSSWNHEGARAGRSTGRSHNVDASGGSLK